ncbi:U-box domain-containing protein 27-like [Silene latifolia]|uniref:U-box domain-containing protein 27-like n=1 Tax=Silene latifolia TaxID=37657 RepID=UPI003D78738A
MVRNELCVTIPCYFKCPISMEVMKSPVSLSTGVTYDRSSIQRWLETGHTTCPATMQPLSSPSFVPNLTLLRLIKLWPTYNGGHDDEQSLVYFRKLVNQAKSSDESCRVLVKSEEFEDSLTKVCLQAKKSEEYCRVLEKSEGLLDTIMRMIKLFDQVNGNVESLGMMLVLLDLVVSDVVVYKELIKCLPKLVFVMQTGTLESRIAIASILLKTVNYDGETKGKIIETPNLILEAYNLVKCDDDSANEAGLGLLSTLAVNSRPLIKELVRLGVVKRAGEILCDKGRLKNKAVILRIMEMLEMVAMSREGRKAISEDDKCVEEIVRRLMKESEKVTEHGATVLWSVCYKFRDEKIVEVVRKCNGVGKCVLLLQSNCKGVVKSMCVDLIKVLRERGKPCLANYDTKTTHVMAY